VLDPETGLRFSSRNLVACLREGAARMGVSMALYEHSGLDARLGAYVDHDLAGYQMATNADVADLEAVMVDEEDAEVNPVGVKGLGEVGIVGTAAAIGNPPRHRRACDRCRSTWKVSSTAWRELGRRRPRSARLRVAPGSCLALQFQSSLSLALRVFTRGCRTILRVMEGGTSIHDCWNREVVQR
jgi:hypothetical protein